MQLSHSRSLLWFSVCSMLGECRQMIFELWFILYCSLLVDYSAGLWGFKFHSKIQVIQNRAMRFFLNVNMNVPIAALQGEMGWVPMRVHIRLAVLRLWHRLCTLPDGRLTGDIFRWSCNLADRGVHNWAADVRNLLKWIGWALFGVNFRPLQEIEAIMGGGRIFDTRPFFARQRYSKRCSLLLK